MLKSAKGRENCKSAGTNIVAVQIITIITPLAHSVALEEIDEKMKICG